MPTPHISAANGQIAKLVLMPGDPLRAKYIADTFLENVVCFNTVRNMFGYTGTYRGRPISVMGSGMGMPSIGIYSYELFKFYDVDTIVRIGSAGAYTADLKLYDVVLAKESWSESTYAKTQSGSTKKVIAADKRLNNKIVKIAAKLSIPLTVGRIHSSDVFYRSTPGHFETLLSEKGCIAVEMESFALFHNAKVLGKQAACLLTISDSLVTHEETTAEERQNAFVQMMKIALELAKK
jgi:purine-nucleoside phosphorylase